LGQQNKVYAEVKLHGILILLHTPFGLTFFNKLAKTRAARIYARFNVYTMPAITALAVFLIVSSLAVVFSNAAAREGARDVGPQGSLLIPGLNPYLPWTYGWLALIITIVVHEAGHGIVARVYNITVESTGILLVLGIIPVGAFVNIKQEELEKTPLKQRSAILTAGPLNNMALAIISLFALYLTVSTLSPLPTSGEPKFGVSVVGVSQGSLAESLGLSKGSIVQHIAGHEVHSVGDVGILLRSNLGNTIEITWQDNKGEIQSHQLTLPSIVKTKQGILGVIVTDLADPSLVLERYKSFFNSNPLALLVPPTLGKGSLTVPYSDMMATKYDSNILGSSFPIAANMLFWLWFINFNVGIFNALPIILPLDGSQLYNSLIESRVTSKKHMLKNASMLLTVAMTAMVFMSFLLPWLPF
jgi:membrane-associated protease RseP (regulator of RpoE activity)